MSEYIIFLITQFLLLLPFALLVFYVIEKFVAMPKYSKYAKIIHSQLSQEQHPLSN